MDIDGEVAHFTEYERKAMPLRGKVNTFPLDLIREQLPIWLDVAAARCDRLNSGQEEQPGQLAAEQHHAEMNHATLVSMREDLRVHDVAQVGIYGIEQYLQGQAPPAPEQPTQ